MKIQQWAPQLWLGQSQLYATNSGVFVSQGEACLVDPCMFPQEMETIASFLREQNWTPRYLILTHSHWDHILGPERFPDVPIIAHANYLSEVGGQNESRIRQQIEQWEEEYGIERQRPFTIPQPDQTFTDTAGPDVFVVTNDGTTINELIGTNRSAFTGFSGSGYIPSEGLGNVDMVAEALGPLN